ncbi:MAG: phosphate acyltransferase [Burkholderiaceae bacterium]
MNERVDSSDGFLARLRARAAGCPARIALSESADPRVLRAASLASQYGFARPILIGRAPQQPPAGIDPAELRAWQWVDIAQDTSLRGVLAGALREAMRGKTVSDERFGGAACRPVDSGQSDGQGRTGRCHGPMARCAPRPMWFGPRSV